MERSKKELTIKKIEPFQSTDSINHILNRIESIDQQIKITSQAILDAQLVKFRSIIFKRKNIFDGFQKRIVESSVNSSVHWHQQHLYKLKGERNKLQFKLDRLTGRVWQRKVLKVTQTISIVLVFLIAISFIIMGLFAVLYLLPIFAMFVIGLIIANKIKL